MFQEESDEMQKQDCVTNVERISNIIFTDPQVNSESAKTAAHQALRRLET